jgi:hypothetical protein
LNPASAIVARLAGIVTTSATKKAHMVRNIARI